MMCRRVAIALLLVSCAKERTDAAHQGPPPSSGPVASASTDADARTKPTTNGGISGGTGASHEIQVTADPDPSSSGVQIYKDPTPVARDHSPAHDLAKQVGGSGTPAKGGRSLVVVKAKKALDRSSLDAATMAYEYVARGRADVKKCFEAVRAKDPAAKGEITLQFTVDTNGSVVDPNVDGFNADVSTCVQNAMPQWKFPAPSKATRFELVLDLTIG